MRFMFTALAALVVMLALGASFNQSYAKGQDGLCGLQDDAGNLPIEFILNSNGLAAVAESQQCILPTVTDRTQSTVRLACVQLPVSCSSSSDCTCSGCCGSWDGSTRKGICQPSC